MTDAELDLAVDRGRAAWPALRPIARDELAAWLAARVALPITDATPLADLYLACACAAGDPAAIAAFDADHLREVAHAGAKLRADPAIVDEARQVVRAILFAPTSGKPPAIASYAGRGDLRGWVRVVAMREVLRLLARDRREVLTDDEMLLDALSPSSDPELEQIKAKYRGELALAFAGAIHALPERDRSLLRLSVIEGLGVEALGKHFGVHHATAARWLIRARAQLLEGTRARLAERLRLDATEVDSVIRLVRSRIEVSLERLLDEG